MGLTGDGAHPSCRVSCCCHLCSSTAVLTAAHQQRSRGWIAWLAGGEPTSVGSSSRFQGPPFCRPLASAWVCALELQAYRHTVFSVTSCQTRLASEPDGPEHSSALGRWLCDLVEMTETLCASLSSSTKWTRSQFLSLRDVVRTTLEPSCGWDVVRPQSMLQVFVTTGKYTSSAPDTYVSVLGIQSISSCSHLNLSFSFSPPTFKVTFKASLAALT